MALTAEESFIKDFKETIRNIAGVKDVYTLPEPDPSWIQFKRNQFLVKGVEDPHFRFLEGTLVSGLGKIKPTKREFLPEGVFSKERVPVSVPKNCMAVFSTKHENIPFKRDSSGGYDYFDARRLDIGGKTETAHFYILPKSVLYKASVSALVISSKKHKSYEALSLQTWNKGKLFLCVIPYKADKEYQYDATVLLANKVGIDYSKETSEYLETLINEGILPPPALAEVSDRNLVIANEETAIAEYYPYSDISVLEEAQEAELRNSGLSS